MDIGPAEIAIVVLVIVLLFGARKLPDLARSVGRSSSEFKKGLREGADEQSEPAFPDPRTHPRSEAGTSSKDDLPPNRPDDSPS